jgi:hypothetical protein
MRRAWTRLPGRPPAPLAGQPPQQKVTRDSGVWRVEKAIAGFRRGSDQPDRIPARSRHLQEERPVSEGELEGLVHEYRRLLEEHKRARPRSRTRRKLAARLKQARRRFELRLAEAPLDDRDRRRWRDRLQSGAAWAAPSGDVRPLLFHGRSASGSELRLLPATGGTVEAVVDGAAVAVLDGADELTRTEPGFAFALDGTEFRETFAVPPSTLAELRETVEAGRRPRSESRRELIEDGLLDHALDLTARGRRALGLDRLPARHVEPPPPPPSISLRGHVSARARGELADALVHVAQVAPSPVLHVSASLTRHEDPALPRPVVAKAMLALGRRVVRAHVAAASESEAIGLLESRLQRNLRRLAERDLGERREGRAPEPGEWRHGDIAPPRPSYYPRPPAERRVVRRKTYAGAPMTLEAAAAEMLLLDHDFHVFVDATDGEDALVYLRPDGVLVLRRQDGGGRDVEPFLLDVEPVPALAVEDAIGWLNMIDESFVFFVDASSGRGAVLYHRYDGHYGLVSAESPMPEAKQANG